MGIPTNHPAVLAAVAKGLIAPEVVREVAGQVPEPVGPAIRRKPAPMVEPSFVAPNCWVVPCEVPSLANSRDSRVRSRVTQAHRKAVSRALGKELWAVAVFAAAYHRGETVTVKLTRLGGKALDRTANLPGALKYIEDAVALMMGADDGAANWNCVPLQEPGGLVGVRIELLMGAST